MNDSIKQCLEIMQHAISNEISLKQACEKLGKGKNYISNNYSTLSERLENGTITKTEYDKFNSLQDEYDEMILELKMTKGSPKSKTKNTSKKQATSSIKNSEDIYSNNLSEIEQEDLVYDATADANFDERSTGEILRDDEDEIITSEGIKLKRILGYKYKILIRGEKALEGELSREEMSKIYQLYSSLEGGNLSLRAVTREFPHLTFRDFKRILRAFNITKSSVPLAPHQLEEMSSDEMLDVVRQNKENSLLKRIDSEKHKYFEKKYYDTQKEIVDIKQEQDWVGQVLDKYFSKNESAVKKHIIQPLKLTKEKTSKLNVGKSLFVLYGDVHYGKKYESPVFGRGYNKEIAHERVMKIGQLVVEEARQKNSKEIVLVCLGDLLESATEKLMHSGHYLEMDLFQDDQIFYAVDSIKEMMLYILENTTVNITAGFISGNHDRIGDQRQDDKNRTAGKIVAGVLQRLLSNEKRIEFAVPKNNLFKLVKDKVCLFCQHGDASLSKKKPHELVNLFGEGRSHYHVNVMAHWHSLKTEEGTNFLSIVIPPVTSTDKFVMEELGNNCLSGFIMGQEPEHGNGFDYKKITLY